MTEAQALWLALGIGITGAALDIVILWHTPPAEIMPVSPILLTSAAISILLLLVSRACRPEAGGDD